MSAAPAASGSAAGSLAPPMCHNSCSNRCSSSSNCSCAPLVLPACALHQCWRPHRHGVGWQHAQGLSQPTLPQQVRSCCPCAPTDELCHCACWSLCQPWRWLCLSCLCVSAPLLPPSFPLSQEVVCSPGPQQQCQQHRPGHIPERTPHTAASNRHTRLPRQPQGVASSPGWCSSTHSSAVGSQPQQMCMALAVVLLASKGGGLNWTGLDWTAVVWCGQAMPSCDCWLLTAVLPCSCPCPCRCVMSRV